MHLAFTCATAASPASPPPVSRLLALCGTPHASPPAAPLDTAGACSNACSFSDDGDCADGGPEDPGAPGADEALDRSYGWWYQNNRHTENELELRHDRDVTKGMVFSTLALT